MRRPMQTSEELEEGTRLACAACGTQVRLEQQGGGRIACCDAPLQAAPRAAGAAGKGEKASCAGCGNEVTIERDGGGRLECCAEEMVRGPA